MSKTLKLADYLGKPFQCSCGKTHSTALEGKLKFYSAMRLKVLEAMKQDIKRAMKIFSA